MVVAFPRAVSIAARKNRNRDDARAIRCHGVEPMMNRTPALVVGIEPETNVRQDLHDVSR
jgi:hypothetical protein